MTGSMVCPIPGLKPDRGLNRGQCLIHLNHKQIVNRRKKTARICQFIEIMFLKNHAEIDQGNQKCSPWLNFLAKPWAI
jgi:hypothetical protein